MVTLPLPGVRLVLSFKLFFFSFPELEHLKFIMAHTSDNHKQNIMNVIDWFSRCKCPSLSTFTLKSENSELKIPVFVFRIFRSGERYPIRRLKSASFLEKLNFFMHLDAEDLIPVCKRVCQDCKIFRWSSMDKVSFLCDYCNLFSNNKCVGFGKPFVMVQRVKIFVLKFSIKMTFSVPGKSWCWTNYWNVYYMSSLTMSTAHKYEKARNRFEFFNNYSTPVRYYFSRKKKLLFKCNIDKVKCEGSTPYELVSDH